MPARVKIARGETRPSQVNYEAPEPRQKAPYRPRDLDPDAKPVWERIIREMPSGVITAADTDILRMYCESVASYTRNRNLLTDTGAVIRGARGRELVVNPLARIVREEREAARLLARELGLTPAARAGLRVEFGPNGELDDILPPLPVLRAVGDD